MTKTILYIEDNPDNIVIVKHILEHEGYQVLIADDGDLGLELAQAHNPDVVICDLHLPGISGIKVVQQMKQMPDLAHIGVIMLTADIYSRPESMEAGADLFLNKPVRRNMLLSRLEELLSRQN